MAQGGPMINEEQFRENVRIFLDGHAVARSSTKQASDFESSLSGEDSVDGAKRFQRAKYDAGLAGLTWPRAYGGQGLSDRYQTIYNDVAADFITPDSIYTIGFGMCIPTILRHGAEELKQRYVSVALQGDEIWCQMFSEPSAGSDVAGLHSKAELDGDVWVLTGQKVWTTQAHRCRFGIVLARTNPDVPKHKGLSMFVLDMRAPGVIIRPLKQMNGGSSFNEIFFDEVRIPVNHILGDPGEGWNVALTTLMNERVAIGAGRSSEEGSPLAPIQLHLDIAEKRGLRSDALVRQELVELFIRFRVLELLGLRIRSTIAAGGVPGPEGSVAKLAGALLARRSSDVAARIAGPTAIAFDGRDHDGERVSQMVLTAPAGAIAGGTSEIMRNILGERVLGLPREPSVDREMAFRDIPRGQK